MVGRVIITFVNFYFMCLLFLMHWEQHGATLSPEACLKLAEGLSTVLILPDLSNQPRPSHGLMAIKACKNCCESNKMSHDLMTNYDACPTSSAFNQPVRVFVNQETNKPEMKQNKTE